MAKCGGHDLGEAWALRARRVENASRGNIKGIAATGEVAEFVNHGTLLRDDQQQQKSKQFNHVFHRIR